MTTREIEMVIEQIADGTAEYDHYGIRFHHDDIPAVGARIPLSRVWVDGDETDERLPGACAIAIKADSDPVELLSIAQSYACGGKGEIIIIASNVRDIGEDAGEIIMIDAIRIA